MRHSNKMVFVIAILETTSQIPVLNVGIIHINSIQIEKLNRPWKRNYHKKSLFGTKKTLFRIFYTWV